MVRVEVTTQMGRRRDDLDGLLTRCFASVVLFCFVLTASLPFSIFFVISLPSIGLYNYLRFDYISEAARYNHHCHCGVVDNGSVCELI